MQRFGVVVDLPLVPAIENLAAHWANNQVLDFVLRVGLLAHLFNGRFRHREDAMQSVPAALGHVLLFLCGSLRVEEIVFRI